MSKLVKDLRIQAIKPVRTGYDNLPANASQYEKRKLMREQVSKGRKSPDTSKMFSVSVPDFKIIYYFVKREMLNKKVLELGVLHPERELIVKNPVI